MTARESNSELASTLPSVVFGAKDAEGRNLFDVSVTIDGESLREEARRKMGRRRPGQTHVSIRDRGLPEVTEE